jgi:hypothetical protein
MSGIGSIYKSKQEQDERKALIKERDKDRKTPEQIRKDLLSYLKPNKLIRFEQWFNRNFGWFFTNGRKQ